VVAETRETVILVLSRQAVLLSRGVAVKNWGESIDAVKNAVVGSRIILLLRIIGSLAGVAGIIARTFWPNNLLAERVLQWGVVTAVALVVISIVIQKWGDHLFDRIAYVIVANRYGYGYEELVVKAHLEEHTRSMRLHRRVHVKATATQNSVRHYLHNLSDSTAGDVEIDDVHKIDPPDIDIDVKKVPELSYKDRLVIEVAFHPHLDKGDDLTYEIREKFPPGAFVTTADELKPKRLPFEYLSWHVNKPTRAFTYMVSIPESLCPTNCGYDVWYGGYSQQRHKQEYRRLKPLFEVSEVEPFYVSMQLNIPFPVLGLIYVIKWEYEQKDAG
jgi:hypothetical protein